MEFFLKTMNFVLDVKQNLGSACSDSLPLLSYSQPSWLTRQTRPVIKYWEKV